MVLQYNTFTARSSAAIQSTNFWRKNIIHLLLQEQIQDLARVTMASTSL